MTDSRMKHYWVSDVAVACLRDQLTWLPYIDVMTDVLDYELCEFPELNKVLAFYYCRKSVHVFDLSPHTTQPLMASLSFDKAQENCNKNFLTLSKRSSKKNEEFIAEVYIGIVSLTSTSCHSTCLFFKFQFIFAEPAQHPTALLKTVILEGALGTCRSMNGIHLSSSLFRVILLGSSMLLFHEAQSISVWSFEWTHSTCIGESNTSETKSFSLCLSDLVQLPLPSILYLESIDTRFLGDKISTPVRYLQNLLNLPSYLSQHEETDWHHLSVCLYPPCAPKSSSIPTRFLTYSVKLCYENLQAISINATKDFTPRYCQVCGMSLNPFKLQRPVATRIIGLCHVNPLKKKKMIPVSVLQDLNDIFLSYHEDFAEETGSCCLNCSLEQWLENASSHTLLCSNDSGTLFCVYHLTPQLRKTSQDEILDQASHFHPRITFSIDTEFRIFAKSTQTDSSGESEFHHLGTFNIPGIPSNIHPLDMKITDTTFWVLYPEDHLNSKRLLRMNLTRLKEGFSSSASLSSTVSGYSSFPKMSELFFPEQHISSNLSLHKVQKNTENPDGAVSSTIAHDMNKARIQCSPYYPLSSVSEIRLNEFEDVTQVVLLPQESQLWQQKTDVCLLPSVFLGLLRLVLDDLGLHPYDETQMDAITEKFLLCATRLFLSRMYSSGQSWLMCDVYLYKACLKFLSQFETSYPLNEKESLKTLLEVVLTIAIRESTEKIGVLGPQSIAIGAATVANFLDRECSQFLKNERHKLFISSVYSMAYVDSKQVGFVDPTPWSDIFLLGEPRPVLLGSHFSISAILPLINLYDIWNWSVATWFQHKILTSHAKSVSQLFQLINGTMSSDWLFFLLIKLNNYVMCWIKKPSGETLDTLTLESRFLFEVFETLYEEIHEEKVSPRRILDQLDRIAQFNFDSFEVSQSIIPEKFQLNMTSCHVYEVLLYLTSSCSFSNLSTQLRRFRSSLQSLIRLSVEWNISEDLLSSANDVLRFRFQTKEALKQEQGSSPYTELVILDSMPLSPYQNILCSSIFSQFFTAQHLLFLFLYFTHWITFHFSSTFRRFECVKSRPFDSNDKQTEGCKTENKDVTVWWDLCLGAGAEGGSVSDGLALGSDGQLTQNHVANLCEIQHDFEIKFSLLSAVMNFLIQSRTLCHTEVQALLISEATRQCSLKEFNFPLVSSFFLKPEILFKPVFLYDTYMAGAQLATGWFKVLCEYSFNLDASVTSGALCYIKGFCEAFWLCSVYFCQKTMPFNDISAHLTWENVFQVLSSALHYDSWILQYDNYCQKDFHRAFWCAELRDAAKFLIPLQNICVNTKRCNANSIHTSQAINTTTTLDVSSDQLSLSLLRGIHVFQVDIQLFRIASSHFFSFSVATDSPLSLQISFLQLVTEYLEKLDNFSEISSDELNEVKHLISEFRFRCWCGSIDHPESLGLKNAYELLCGCPYLKEDVADLTLELLHFTLQALESGNVSIEELFQILQSMTNPILTGIFLTYVARLTLIISPTHIRARFLTQLFHGFLLKRLNKPDQVALHSLLMASFIELKLHEPDASFSFSKRHPEEHQLPPCLFQGLNIFCERIQKNNFFHTISSKTTWKKLQCLVPEVRGVGPDFIELLNIQKKFIHNALLHMESSKFQSIIIPYAYFGAIILPQPTTDNVKCDKTLSSGCCVERETLFFLDNLAVLKLELLAFVNRYTNDVRLVKFYHKSILKASAEHTVFLLSFAGLLQRVAWCLHSWSFLPINDILEIFLYSFISTCYFTSKQPSLPSHQATSTFEDPSSKRSRKTSDTGENFLQLENQEMPLSLPHEQESTHSTYPIRNIMLSRQLSLELPKPFFRDLPEIVWKNFIHVIEGFDVTRPLAQLDLNRIFEILILYKEIQRIPLPSEVTNWVYTHPFHTFFPLLFLQTILSGPLFCVRETVAGEFLAKQLETQSKSSIYSLPLVDILSVDKQLSESNKKMFRTYLLKKLQHTIVR